MMSLMMTMMTQVIPAQEGQLDQTEVAEQFELLTDQSLKRLVGMVCTPPLKHSRGQWKGTSCKQELVI